MKSMLLTLDYELYGNGSGNVFKHIIEPTDNILAMAQKYNAKITFFFEVIEYWKLKEEWEKGNSMGYQQNPIDAIERQLCEACRHGHDIQLHLHPQWVDARWENGKWVVNVEKWRLGGYNGEGDYTLTNLFKRGKQTLEDLLRPIKPNYECIAMRAGGFNIQPSDDIVKSMHEAELTIDSSIYPGGKETGVYSNYDYTNISPDIGIWEVGTTLEAEGKSGILELPIVAFPMIRFKKFMTWERVKGFIRNRKSAQENLAAKTSSVTKKSSVWDKVKYFFQIEWQTWDYCLFSSLLHKQFLKKVSLQKRDILVLVGHPKSYSDSRGMEYLLKEAEKAKYKFETMSEIWHQYK